MTGEVPLSKIKYFVQIFLLNKNDSKVQPHEKVCEIMTWD
jgi:hypothetical protein